MQEAKEIINEDNADEEMLIIADQAPFESSEANVSMRSESVRSRGRPKIPS